MLKIFTLNLYNKNRWEERSPLVMEALRKGDADVIGLQEVWLPIDQAGEIARELNAHAPDRPYSVHVTPKWGEGQQEGIALLSRLPVLAFAQVDLPEANRVGQCICVETGGREVHIANTHLHHMPILDEAIRLPQMTHLLGWLFEKGPNSVLTGDLNALPASKTIALAKKRLVSAYERASGGEPITWPTPLESANYPGIEVTLDYILFTEGALQVVEAHRGADTPHLDDPFLYPSDHYGLFAAFEVVDV